MCQKVDSNDSFKKENLEFLLFNLVLNETDKFTYEGIVEKVKEYIQPVQLKQLEPNIKRTLDQLREDGYISERGSYYLVV